MLYLDSSSLLKLLWRESESEAVGAVAAAEDVVVVSSLAELETEVQMKAAWPAGRYRRGQWRRLRAKLAELRDSEPFRFQTLPGTMFRVALRQHAAAGRMHCRTLGRLHLGAMEEIQIRRLMTDDRGQGAAAATRGFDVLMPGSS